MKKNILKTTLLGSLLCLLGLNSYANNEELPADMLKVSYVDMSATGSLANIPASAYAAPNIVVFGFADIKTSSVNMAQLAVIRTAMQSENSSARNFLSLGGERGQASDFKQVGLSHVVSNMTAQIKMMNNMSLPNGKKISGVDLDLEGADWTSDMINELAARFKAEGLIVTATPQAYLAADGLPRNVDPAQPTNLGLTASGASNVYGKALANGNVNYLFVQTYNTSGWTVGGKDESQPEFFNTIAQALNMAVKEDCSATTTLCIKSGTQIVIGQIANAGAGGFGIYGRKEGNAPITAYEHQGILNNFKAVVGNTLNTYSKNVKGLMVWSLNGDYSPALFGDNFAVRGGFSATLFGATPIPPAPPLPYFILQVSNTGPDQPGQGAFSSGTFVLNGQQYYIFGNVWDQPIAPGNQQSWGTRPSSQNPQTPYVVDSANLNAIFANGARSFKTSQILINGYPNNSVLLGRPAVQYDCTKGRGYTFEAGHAYNVMLNAANNACDIVRMN